MGIPVFAPSRNIRTALHRSLLDASRALVVLVLSGCAVGPDYKQPDVAMPDAWQYEVLEDLDKDEEPLVRWWTVLGDTLLTALIREAELSSLDLASAVARVQEARAVRGVAIGGLLPDVFLEGAYTRTQISENSEAGTSIIESGGEVKPVSTWDTGFTFTWELDVFGRVRRQVEAATADMEASIEDYRDVLVSMHAEVAATYINIRTLQAQLDYARANADAQTQALELAESRFNAGLTAALDVAQAESNLYSTLSKIPSLESQLVAAMNRLAVLLANHPGTLNDRLSPGAPIPDPPEELTTGLPVDLLRRRPDVRRAERELAAQTALIGVATGELYPIFSLDGFLGLRSLSVDDLFSTGSTQWGIAPGFSWNIFSSGRVRNRIKIEEARTSQALIFYEQAVLTALEEVESAMVAYQKERARRDRLAEAVAASERSVELVRSQYVSGLTDFQNYLDTQRTLLLQQDELARSEGQVVKNLIFLNTALGGGWSLESAEPGTGDEHDSETVSDEPEQEN